VKVTPKGKKVFIVLYRTGHGQSYPAVGSDRELA
jgi:hypothetical protein